MKRSADMAVTRLKSSHLHQEDVRQSHSVTAETITQEWCNSYFVKLGRECRLWCNKRASKHYSTHNSCKDVNSRKTSSGNSAITLCSRILEDIIWDNTSKRLTQQKALCKMRWMTMSKCYHYTGDNEKPYTLETRMQVYSGRLYCYGIGGLTWPDIQIRPHTFKVSLFVIWDNPCIFVCFILS